MISIACGWTAADLFGSDLRRRLQHAAEQAQAQVPARDQHAGLRAGDRVLEIGCGWGGLPSMRRARASVHGLTISPSQLQVAQQRIAAPAGQLAQLELRDYRDIEGSTTPWCRSKCSARSASVLAAVLRHRAGA
jgi:cyclopropane-fatty-acyl-phospholipid synthase